ncbi:MAG: hypothetical protein KGI50_03445 [Patescibacteria group bacterium]|nr:hypothetical protein [Patescibacteria group bacterium]MDE2438346.1 hypothetical protein [Patescibacteria group bacterium]
MKIFIVCSKYCYDRIPPIKAALEAQGHVVTLPNSYDEPFWEERMRERGEEAHRTWKAKMLMLQEEKVRGNDALLVLNFDKGDQKNYIGGATFLEIFQAWRIGRDIFLWNEIPNNLFTDELLGMNPVVIEGDLAQIVSSKTIRVFVLHAGSRFTTMISERTFLLLHEQASRCNVSANMLLCATLNRYGRLTEESILELLYFILRAGT